MKSISYRTCYLISILGIILISIYPVYMGIRTMIDYLSAGAVDASNYQKYIIPYTPICIALIMSTLLMPVFMKFCKKYSLLFVSVLGIVLFFIFELLFEQIKVTVNFTAIPIDTSVSGYTSIPVESWQSSLCIVTPEVIKSIGEPIFDSMPGIIGSTNETIYAANDPAYKIHFYIIAIVIILAVINVIHGFCKMAKTQNVDKKKPLYMQLISVTIFIGLCILACFTAFFRTGAINISPVSAILMSIFFVVFGVTFGVYFGCIFYGRKKLYSLILPSIAAAFLTVVMYIGELILMGGVLFKYGSGLLFESVLEGPFAPIDFFIVIISGIVTYAVLKLIAKKT